MTPYHVYTRKMIHLGFDKYLNKSFRIQFFSYVSRTYVFFSSIFLFLLSFHSVFECIECFQPIIENRDEAQRIYGLDDYKLTDFSETWTRIAHQINIDSSAVYVWYGWNETYTCTNIKRSLLFFIIKTWKFNNVHNLASSF